MFLIIALDKKKLYIFIVYLFHKYWTPNNTFEKLLLLWVFFELHFLKKRWNHVLQQKCSKNTTQCCNRLLSVYHQSVKSSFFNSPLFWHMNISHIRVLSSFIYLTKFTVPYWELFLNRFTKKRGRLIVYSKNISLSAIHLIHHHTSSSISTNDLNYFKFNWST